MKSVHVEQKIKIPTAGEHMAIIIQQDATEYSLFKSVNRSTCFWWYFTHHQLITLYLQYLALMSPVLLPVVNVAGWELPPSHFSAQLTYTQ